MGICGLAALIGCAWLMISIQGISANMCGSKPYNSPAYECCGRGRENIVFNTKTEMCLMDIYSGVYHIRSKMFPCGNLSKKYNYLTELCLRDIYTSVYRIIPRFAYCAGTKFDLRFNFCYYHYATGRFMLSPRRKRRSLDNRSKLA